MIVSVAYGSLGLLLRGGLGNKQSPDFVLITQVQEQIKMLSRELVALPGVLDDPDAAKLAKELVNGWIGLLNLFKKGPNFIRFAIPVLPIIFLALLPYLPKRRAVIWILTLVTPVLSAVSAVGVRNAVHLR